MRLGIVGGGPAGIFAALSAASHDRSAEIEVLELSMQPLDKVLLSGGGRCNVTHHCYNPALLLESYPRGHRELRGPFSRFQPRDTVDWFESHGVRLKVESDGRIFPVTDNSQTIVDCLLGEAEKLGVAVLPGSGVRSIRAEKSSRTGGSFDVELRGGTHKRYDRTLVATGSSRKGYKLASSLGHSITPCVPSLFTFKVRDPRLQGMSGISFEEAELTLTTGDGAKLTQRGPLLVTHWGLSGPAVLRLSAWGARALHECKYQADLSISFEPAHSRDAVYQDMLYIKERHPRRQVDSSCPFALPKRYWKRIVELNGISAVTTWANLTREAMLKLASELVAARFEICGKGEFKEEFVTCGGVNLKEIDFRTMQSKICPGLYFAGEILDIDGITGGFNFQNAWTTGWVAGLSMVADV